MQQDTLRNCIALCGVGFNKSLLKLLKRQAGTHHKLNPVTWSRSDNTCVPRCVCSGEYAEPQVDGKPAVPLIFGVAVAWSLVTRQNVVQCSIWENATLRRANNHQTLGRWIYPVSWPERESEEGGRWDTGAIRDQTKLMNHTMSSTRDISCVNCTIISTTNVCIYTLQYSVH